MKLKHFLLTVLILFLGVSGVYATRRYVRFTSVPLGANSYADLPAALAAAGIGDTVLVATGLYIADNAEFNVPAGVTLIGGYAKNDMGATTRQYPGQFIPFSSSSSAVDTTKFTVLDGNSYKRTRSSEKHRVVTVNAGGVVDGCLIRNGHARNKNGGGVLLNGGKLYNSIIRGNVAMSHPDSAEALGGGVFIQNGGDLINCVVAYNMANDGYGVAAGTGGGKMINNTITANTYSPVFAKISAGTFHRYQGNDDVNYRPTSPIPTWNADNQLITMREFYISRTETTQGQYAVFCAAMDMSQSGNYGQLNVTTLKGFLDPVRSSGTLDANYGFGTHGHTSGLQNILESVTNANLPGLKFDAGVWHPVVDTVTVEYPMGYVSWYGSLAYAVWLGGGLPTSAQWEFAARREPNGTVNNNLYSGAYGTTSDTEKDTWMILDTIAWVINTKSIDTAPPHNLGIGGTSRPHEVARKRPNAMGIYDMTGNVEEWVADCLSTPATFPYSASPTDPIYNPTTVEYRLGRGGPYNNDSRSTFFMTSGLWCNAPTITSDHWGFRPTVAF